MVGAGLVAVAALAAGVFLTTQSDTDSGLVQVNGRVESDQIVVSARVPARIADVLVREGDVVKAGQVMLKLNDDGVAARTAQAAAAATAQMAQVRALESSLSLLRSETAMLTQTAQAEVTAAQAELNRLGVVAQQSALERDRVKQLADQGFVGPQALERAQVATKSALEQYSSARAQVQKAQVNLQNARLAPQRIASRSAVMTWGALAGLKYTALMPQPAAATRATPSARRQPDTHRLRFCVLMFTVSLWTVSKRRTAGKGNVKSKP